MEQWTTTSDLKLAAAFGTLGMPIRISVGYDMRSSKESCRFSIALGNVEGTMKTTDLRARLANGKLEAADAAHPFLTILRAYLNRTRLLELIKGSVTGLRLVRVPNTTPALWQYVHAEGGLPGVKPGDTTICTGDLKMVAALGIIGCPLLKIEGAEGSQKFWVGVKLWGNGSQLDNQPPRLMAAWRADMESIPWQHPFAQAMRGLYNRERMLDAVKRTDRKIVVRPGRGIKSAIISENAAPQAWDAVKGFLGA